MLSRLGAGLTAYRALRVLGRQLLGTEPRIAPRLSLPLEFHGSDAGGWMIRRDSLTSRSVVVDVGIGEDVSFSESISRKYRCVVNGFDPTPKAIEFLRRLDSNRMTLFEYGLGNTSGPARFYLPNNDAYVSGSIVREPHLGRQEIEVQLVTLTRVFELIRSNTIDVLKLDIEGTEYDVIESDDFRRSAPNIGQLCVEFHHRWPSRGKSSTLRAVRRLREVGFECAWVSRATNEEFLFVRADHIGMP